MSELVLGVSAYYHDSAAALVRDGSIVAAAQQERFSRIRHDASFPADAVRYCLEEAGVTMADISKVAYYEDPGLKFSRVMATYVAMAPRSFLLFERTAPHWLRRKLWARSEVRKELARLNLGSVPEVTAHRHHDSHAASAFFPSPYQSAAVLCVDSVGEWATTSLWHGAGSRIIPLAEIRFPHSLGLLYSAFTYFCGFKVDSGEYKLMGLAPYGVPRFASVIREKLIDVREDGSFRLNLNMFEFLNGEVMTGEPFARLFGGPARMPEAELTEREFDLAASVQAVAEDVMLRLGRTAQRMTGERFLCLAGGVALNCVANGKLAEAGIFDQIWVQPAAGDAGGALGAALLSASLPVRRREHVAQGRDAMSGALLGPGFANEEIKDFLEQNRLPHLELSDADLTQQVAGLLADGKVVGWFQGRMEFGPRALGARSILGDPRDADMQRTMNLKIKFRESFRPFAPMVLAADATEYFDLTQDSPYMLIVAPVSEGQRLGVRQQSALTGLDQLKIVRSTIPAVTHVDMSARVQTVSADNARLHDLLQDFKSKTGCSVLVNTSFNVRGEPIVATPEQAYRCFMRTDIDALALGNFLLFKPGQPEWTEATDWRAEIPLD